MAGVVVVDLDGTVGADGATTPDRAIAVGGHDGSNLKRVLVDSSGRPIVSGAQADGAALAGNPIVVAGKDGSTARALLVDASGRPLVTVATALPAGTNLVGKVQLRNPGNTVDIGDATNPVRVDPTGTTTQPISAASLPLPTGSATLAEQQTQTTALQLIDDVVHTTNAALGKVAAIGGQLDDTSVTDATENNVAPIRITAKRALHVAPHDASGNAITSLLDGGARRIQVEASIAPGQSVSIGAPVPENPTNIVRQKLLNSGSSNMLVDGDPTPIVFQFDADATDDIKIGEIRLVFSATAINMDGNSFGADPDLANGCLLEVNSGGSLVTLANVVRNEDFLSFPGGLPFLDRSGVQDILAVSYNLGGAVKLIAGTGDYVRMTIRDDINGTSYKLFEATVYGVKV